MLTKYLIILPFPDETQTIGLKTFARASCTSTFVEDKAVFKTYWHTSSNFMSASFSSNTLFLKYNFVISKCRYYLKTYKNM